MGIELAISRATSLTAGVSAIPIKEQTSWVVTFWVPVVLCAISFGLNVFYVVFNNHFVPQHLRLTGSKSAAMKKNSKAKIDWRVINHLPWCVKFLIHSWFSPSESIRLLSDFHQSDLANTRRSLGVLSPSLGLSG